jgi:16S rRNA (cytosine967-C5)-methyltransferase
MPAPAREAAFRVLRAIADGRIDLGEALSRSRDPLTDVRDRALATDLATGTLRWRGALDYQLQRLSTKPLARLDPAVLDTLRLGAYQILHLERVPISAVVNDAVQIVKTSRFRSAAGFVNALLRRLARERAALPWPGRDAILEHLSVVHSHPTWLVERWLARYGADETEKWLRFNNAQPAMTLAANRLRGDRDALAAKLREEQIETAPTPVAPYGLSVVNGRALTSTAFRDGLCLVQDEASQIVPELVRAAPGHRVLDACASPGGKTIALAAQCAPDGYVVATDVRHRRVDLLAATIGRARTPNVGVVHIAESGRWPFRDSSFDRVLIDAPCSGLGTIRRDPDIRWRRDPADFPALTGVQLDLLRRIAPLVRPQGRIVYSTCSSEPEENEAVVAAFLGEAPEFLVIDVEQIDGLAPAIAAMRTAEGFLRTTPRHGLEAFFGAVMQRK